MKKLKSLIISLVLALTCISMVTPTDFVQAASIKLNKTNITMYTGKTSTLRVNGTSKKVTWYSSNRKVATVSSKGVVSAKSPGKATITAKVNKKNLKCKVTVKKSTSSKKAALRAYYYFLKDYNFTYGSYTRGFNLAYINNDSIPELLIFDGDYHAAGAKVYSYVNGKVKYVDQFGGWGKFEYKEKKGIIRSYWFGQDHDIRYYYKWNGYKLSTIMTSDKVAVLRSDDTFGYNYYINDKKVTRSTYKNSIAPYEKGLKSAKISNSYAVTDSVMKKKLLY